MNYITSYCYINNNKLTVNGEVVAERNEDLPENWLKHLYSLLEEKYPKFHKMDALSQLAYIASENIIAQNSSVKSYGDDEISMIFCNRTSSLHTDRAYQDSYVNQGSPSPSLFVYTLPNILIGELSIKNKWYGENIFSVLPDFDAKYFSEYPNLVLNDGSKAGLCGWIEMNGSEMEAFLFFIEKQDTKTLNLPLTENNIERLYNEQNG